MVYGGSAPAVQMFLERFTSNITNTVGICWQILTYFLYMHPCGCKLIFLHVPWCLLAFIRPVLKHGPRSLTHVRTHRS